MDEEASIVIGGEAGDGVRASGKLLGKIFNRHGLYTFIRDDYQSLIRGGHNFSQIRAGPEKIWSQQHAADVVIALDERSVENHEDRLTEKGILIYDSDKLEHESENSEAVPLSSMVEEVEGIPIMRNSAALGSLACLYGLKLEVVKESMKDAYGEKAGKNIELADKGYEFAKENLEKIGSLEFPDREDTPVLTGNKSIALGASKAGLSTYIAYPMTPSTSILHFAAAHQDDLGLTVIQPENEIGVINMALGSAYAGARTMVATSGGGYSLMQEAISLAGMSESPILVIECQRAGPSTGVPTYTGQADLNLTLNSGHGDFPRIVLAPGDQEEAFYLSGEGLNLAWKYQTPVILLSDKHLSESAMSADIDPGKVNPEEGKMAENPGSEYKRYQITDDGVSPIAFPGEKDAVVKTTSYEHTDFGWTTEEPEEIEKMQDKRLRKLQSIKEEIRNRDTVKLHGDEESGNLVIGWGSTKGVIMEAMKHLDPPVKFAQAIYLEPFPQEEISKLMKKAYKVVSVEGNATGQLADLIKKETFQEVDEGILKYDSRPFDPLKLAEKLEGVFE